MTNDFQHTTNVEQLDPRAGNLTLLANGVDGGWDVSIDAASETPEQWFLQIEGPSLLLSHEIDLPQLKEMLGFIRQGEKRHGSYVLGCNREIPLRFFWDAEPEARLFIAVGPPNHQVARIALGETDIDSIARAAEQALADLE